jgi:DNA-binding transcriptional ArsR family regulator
MAGDVDLAAVGAVVAEPSRARMLLALYDGRALPASVLATEAGVAPSTASEHLGRLVDSGFVCVEQHGRHRYYRLRGREVAELMEAMAQLAPEAPVRSLREHTRQAAMRRGRTCYDHLAGKLGVELLQAMLRQGLVTGHDGAFRPDREQLASRSRDPIYRVTGLGRDRLAAFGVDAPEDAALAHCVDWTEQRHHLAGSVAAAVADRMFERGWLERAPRGRAVRVSPLGEVELERTFGVVLDGVVVGSSH